MASDRDGYPQLWVTICRRVRLPPTASVDRVRAAYGNVVGRGTIQRIQEGIDPRFATLRNLADQLGMHIAEFLANDEREPRRPPPGYADRIEVSESDWALLQDVKSGALDAELDVIRKRARELERRVEERISKLKDKAR